MWLRFGRTEPSVCVYDKLQAWSAMIWIWPKIKLLTEIQLQAVWNTVKQSILFSASQGTCKIELSQIEFIWDKAWLKTEVSYRIYSIVGLTKLLSLCHLQLLKIAAKVSLKSLCGLTSLLYKPCVRTAALVGRLNICLPSCEGAWNDEVTFLTDICLHRRVLWAGSVASGRHNFTCQRGF